MDKAIKYNSLDAVISAVKTEWAECKNIEGTEENRAIVSDGLYWCGVEFARFNYMRAYLIGLVKWFREIRKGWEVEK